MTKAKYAFLRWFIRTAGRLSTGIDMSFKYGFTSGEMLDYIYENKAHGRFIIGKIFDRIYLSNVGWKAIRQRKDNLKMFIKKTIMENEKKGAKTVLFDMASGPARYMIESLGENGKTNAMAICSDIDARWLDNGRKLAKEKGVANIKFLKGNAFDLKHLKSIRPKPNVIISSGFYDWITDDSLVKKSLSYAYKVLPKNGVIIFTNQASHKQMEFVSEVFTDFNKKPLRMKTRSPNLINGWAKKAGFKRLETEIDERGLYSVTRGFK